MPEPCLQRVSDLSGGAPAVSRFGRARHPFSEQAERDAKRNVERRHEHGQRDRRERERTRGAIEIDRRSRDRGDAAENEAETAGDVLSCLDERVAIAIGRSLGSSRVIHNWKANVRQAPVVETGACRVFTRRSAQRALNHLSSMTSTGFEYD